jgi:uncharacterized protein
MANWSDPRTTTAGARSAPREAAFDAGLRSYMLSVYNYMASGVLLTGIVALMFASWLGAFEDPALAAQRFNSLGVLKWAIILAPLGFVMAISFGINRMKTSTAQALFWTFAAVMGLSMASLFIAFTGQSIATTFFATAAAFAGLSLYGYTTKRDLSAFGTFLIMGLVGLIVASVINIFVQSSALQFAISFIGVLLFAGLTAYDTQKIKSVYFQVAGSEFYGKAVVLGALNLYLDFVNMFTFLLQLVGDRR